MDKNRTELVSRKFRVFLAIVGSAVLMVTHFNCSSEGMNFKVLDGEVDLSSLSSLNGSFQKETVPEGSPAMGDRYLLANTFIGIFGPAAKPFAFKYIHENPTDFSGICNAYETVFHYDTYSQIVQENPEGYCWTNSPATYAPVRAASSSVRDVNRQNICSVLVERPDTLLYALSQATNLNLQGVNEIPPLNANYLASAFEMFYLGKPAPGMRLRDALTNVYAQASDPVTGWQAVLYTICFSGHWQAL